MDDEELISVHIDLEDIVINTSVSKAMEELRSYVKFLEEQILPSKEIRGDYERENRCKGEIEGVKYALKVLSYHCCTDFSKGNKK